MREYEKESAYLWPHTAGCRSLRCQETYREESSQSRGRLAPDAAGDTINTSLINILIQPIGPYIIDQYIDTANTSLINILIHPIYH